MGAITLSNTTAAFLKRGGEYLLMKRALSRKVAPGVWSGVGGKMECAEINDPRTACLREIEEETGIAAGWIRDLTLRYVVIRRWRDTIRQSYIYFGETSAEPSTTTEEGELHWIPEHELLDRPYTATFAAMLTHYLQTPDPAHLIVGTTENDHGKCRMIWAVLEDFETQQEN